LTHTAPRGATDFPYARLLAELETLPVNIARQARMGELLDVVHDHSADGAEAGLPEVWRLPEG
jgi:L-rhamnose mutarotase